MPNVAVFRGDTIELEVTIVQPDNINIPVDLTDKKLEFFCKHSHTDSDDMAVIKKSSLQGGGIVKTEPLSGKIRVDIAPNETINLPAPYVLTYTLVVTDARNREFTLVKNNIQILAG